MAKRTPFAEAVFGVWKLSHTPKSLEMSLRLIDRLDFTFRGPGWYFFRARNTTVLVLPHTWQRGETPWVQKPRRGQKFDAILFTNLDAAQVMGEIANAPTRRVRNEG